MLDEKQTQSSLAQSVGVAQGTVFKWLNGTMPGSAELYRLARRFRRSMDWFLQADEDVSVIAEDAAARRRTLRHCEQLLRFLEVSGWSLEGLTKFLIFTRDLMPARAADAAQAEIKTLPSVATSQYVSPVLLDLDSLLGAIRKEIALHDNRAVLAKKFGVHLSQLGRWLSGDGKPNAEATLEIVKWAFDSSASTQQKSPDLAVTKSEPMPVSRKDPKHEIKSQSEPKQGSHKRTRETTRKGK